jgi:hypothetical protein
MSGETVGWLLGGIVCLGVLVAVHFGLRKALKREVLEEETWNEVYRREEDQEFPEVFKQLEGSDQSQQKTGMTRIYRLSDLSKVLRDARRAKKVQEEQDDDE